jgi:hypothetical protein
MDVIYPTICKAAEANVAMKQAAQSTLLRIAAHAQVDLSKSECLQPRHEVRTQPNEGSTTLTTNYLVDPRVVQLLLSNLDYIVDAFCEDLRASSVRSRFIRGTYPLSRLTTAKIPISSSGPRTGVGPNGGCGQIAVVLETMLRYSKASTDAPLLRDVLKALIAEVITRIWWS